MYLSQMVFFEKKEGLRVKGLLGRSVFIQIIYKCNSFRKIYCLFLFDEFSRFINLND